MTSVHATPTALRQRLWSKTSEQKLQPNKLHAQSENMSLLVGYNSSPIHLRVQDMTVTYALTSSPIKMGYCLVDISYSITILTLSPIKV